MPAETSERPVSAKPVGGKALARLQLFEEARDIAVAEERPAGRRAKPDSGASARAATAVNEEVGDRYASAAMALTFDGGTEELETRVDDTGAAARATPGEPAEPAPAARSWRFLGPTFQAGGQTYGSTRVDVSGRVAALAVDPSNSAHIIVGSAAGGIWRTTDTGATWSPVADSAPTLTCGAVAFDPTNPRVIYVGTGEGNFYASLGAGLLRSTDGGLTFSLVAGAPFMGNGFYDLIVDPRNGLRLFAATVGGLYVSVDGGTTWKRPITDRCWSISLRPRGRTWELLAATAAGLKRSTNSGTSFTAVAIAGAPTSWDRLAVAHAPSQTSVAYLWGASGDAPYLARRSGSTWTRITNAPADVNQAWYDWFVGVAPDDASMVFLGAVHAYRGRPSGSGWAFENISSRQSGDSIHPDQHAVAFDPGNPAVMYIGCDGGVYRSPNRGTNWTAINRGLGIAETEYLAQRAGTTNWILAGTQDNGSMRYTGSAQWEHVADGDGGDCGVNRSDGSTSFHSYYGMGMERSTNGGGSGSWSWIGPNVADTYQALFYPPLEVNGTTVAQAGQSVFVSRNSGTAFTELNLGGGVATAMHAPSTDRVYIGTNSGRVVRVDWSGTSWSGPTALTSPRVNVWISDVAVSPSRLWATSTSTGGGRVFRSGDGGTTWTDCTAGLPALPINSVEIDPWNENRVWVAADLGVYESWDAGATWNPITAGLPNVLVADLVVHPHARVLRAGTRNRGVWEFPIDDPLDTPICGTQFSGQLAANASGRWFTFNWPSCWHVLWTVMPTSPNPGAAEVQWTTEVERATDEFVTYWIKVQNLTAVAVSFEARFAILSRS